MLLPVACTDSCTSGCCFLSWLYDLYEFITLTKQEQAEAVWGGEYFWFRKEETCMVLLYKVHDFYIEVYYDEKHNQILRFTPFSSKQRLKLYFQLQLN
jgi:hypothetical protein